MTNFDQSDPPWLQALLLQAIEKKWCTQINCTTCASGELRQALGLLDMPAKGSARFIKMTPEAAQSIILDLKAYNPQNEHSYELELAVRWILYEVWRNYEDRYFTELDGTWAGEVLSGMRTHYQQRQEALRIHNARQGVKMRDWEE